MSSPFAEVSQQDISQVTLLQIITYMNRLVTLLYPQFPYILGVYYKYFLVQNVQSSRT